LQVSEISLGTVEIGLDYGVAADGHAKRPSEQEAARLLHGALDSGINLIDTARVYGDSEDIIGRVLRHRRDQFILCSKVPSYSDKQFDLPTLREQLRQSVEQSLRALKTDHIDILMIHSAPTEVIVQGDVVKVLEDLRGQGKFLWIGASTYGEEAALQAIRSGRYDCLQVASSAIDRRLERNVFPEAKQQDVGLVARSVLLKGALTSRHQYLPAHLTGLKTAAARLEALAAHVGIGLPELAYRYLLGQDPPQTALVGASSTEEMESAVRFANAGPLGAEVVNQIRQTQIEDQRDLNPATWGIG